MHFERTRWQKHPRLAALEFRDDGDKGSVG
jgi:hypothetical protein